MYRGTTPSLTLHFNEDISKASDIWAMLWADEGRSKLTLKKSEGRVDVQEDGKTVVIRLTEGETLSLGQTMGEHPLSSTYVYVQAKVQMPDGTIRATKPQLAPSSLWQIIDDGVMADG